MWLIAWVGSIVLLGVLVGILGALADRANRPGVTVLGDVISAFFEGRFQSLRRTSRKAASSS